MTEAPTPEGRMPLLAQTLEKMEKMNQSMSNPMLSLLTAAGVRELGLSIADNPEHPLVKAVKRMFLAIDILDGAITISLAEVVKHQHDGTMPEDCVEEYDEVYKVYQQIFKDHAELL